MNNGKQCGKRQVWKFEHAQINFNFEVEKFEPPNKRMTPKLVKSNMKTSKAAASNDGRRSGRVTYFQTWNVSAPRERAAASSFGSRRERVLPTMRMTMVVL